MMKGLNTHTGYLLIDHTDSPGISASEIPERLRNSTIIVGSGATLERDTKNCTHCERGIILNPGRVRDRERCPYCHHYICDACFLLLRITGKCVPMKQVLDQLSNRITNLG